MPYNFRDIEATCCKCDPPSFPEELFDEGDEEETPILVVGGHRMFRRLPQPLIKALFVPCMLDEDIEERRQSMNGNG